MQLCVPRIEAEAPGDYDWLYRPIGGVFKQADLPETSTSTVARYRGDNIRFFTAQNTWVRATYECGFDTAKQQIAYMRVRPGILGKTGPIAAIPVGSSGNPVAVAASSAPRPPGTVPSVQPGVPVAAPATPPSDLRKISEPDSISVRQIAPGTKPPRS